MSSYVILLQILTLQSRRYYLHFIHVIFVKVHVQTLPTRVTTSDKFELD